MNVCELRQVRADHGGSRTATVPAWPSTTAGPEAALAGADDPHGGYGDEDEDSGRPVGPVDPPGPEATMPPGVLRPRDRNSSASLRKIVSRLAVGAFGRLASFRDDRAGWGGRVS